MPFAPTTCTPGTDDEDQQPRYRDRLVGVEIDTEACNLTTFRGLIEAAANQLRLHDEQATTEPIAKALQARNAQD